jgi:hypothetical protein
LYDNECKEYRELCFHCHWHIELWHVLAVVLTGADALALGVVGSETLAVLTAPDLDAYCLVRFNINGTHHAPPGSFY